MVAETMAMYAEFTDFMTLITKSIRTIIIGNYK